MSRFVSVQQTTVPAATAAKVRFVHQSDPEADERRGTVVGGNFKLTLFSLLVLNPNLIDAAAELPTRAAPVRFVPINASSSEKSEPTVVRRDPGRDRR